MSDYERCKTCGEYGWTGASAARFGGHICPPTWEARIHETKYENEWTEIHARDAEEAASKFCQQHDSNGDYDIIQSGEAEIEVRKWGEDKIALIDISAESVPTYYAHRRAAPVEPETALKTAQGEPK